MNPPAAAVAQAHRRLQHVLAELTDADVAHPSLLPGWTRGHVIAHLADAARARGRVPGERPTSTAPLPELGPWPSY